MMSAISGHENMILMYINIKIIYVYRLSKKVEDLGKNRGKKLKFVIRANSLHLIIDVLLSPANCC